MRKQPNPLIVVFVLLCICTSVTAQETSYNPGPPVLHNYILKDLPLGKVGEMLLSPIGF
ncbi:hypothetical protein ACFL7D_09650 [candidate division KSB1 bacterium]